MTPLNHPTSSLRLFSTRAIRIALLFGLIGTVVTVLSAPSFASSIGQKLFASAAAIMGGNATRDTHANHSSSVEFVASAESATMSTERHGHTATRLADGRVLISGGENASGVLNQTEIYDPAAATFTAAANMTSARVDHSATLLADGRVLIAGGSNGGSALATTEFFDPASGSFTSGPTMSVARAGHSATLFADGRVLIVGGDSGGTAEVLDLAAGTSSAVGSLGVARSHHSAALLQDGRVLVVGGRDAAGNELSSGEVFDTPAGTFWTIANLLKVARVSAHLRVLFDGKVQIIGGNNDGSMEVYDPIYEGFGAYAHVLPEGDTCTGLSGQILNSPTRAALFHNGQSDALLDRSGHTITELNGQALVLGGVNSSGMVLNSSAMLGSSSASISTDKMDYQPGDTAHISGRGFQPGEVVRLKIHEDPHTPQERGFDVTADAEGNFSGDYVVTEYDLDMKFLAGARGLSSGRTAQTTFTDGNVSFSGIVRNSVTNAPIPGAQVVASCPACPATVTVTTNGSGNYSTGNLNYAGGGNAIVTVTASAPGFTPVSVGPTSYTNNSNNVINFLLTPTVRTTSTSVSCTPNPTVVGGGVSCTSTVTDTNGAGATAPTGTVNLTTGGTGTFTPAASCTLSPISSSASSCSVTYTPTQRGTGTHNITSAYAGSATHSGSTSAPFALTVNKRNTLTTVSSSLNPSTFGESVSFTATVIGTGAGAGNPSGGSVQFKIDGANFGAPVALTAGSASSGSISTLTAGNHTVEAIFTSSDTNFNDSNDLLDGGQVVNKRNTLTTVSSSLNPSTFGESVSFTATVVGTGAGAGNPSGGSVQFKIDGANFGVPVALTAGSASSGSISTLTAGNHTVEAIFTSSDTNFNDSNDLLDGGQTVNKRNTLTTVSSSLNPSTFGESVSFTATVVGTGAGAGNPSGGSVQFKIDGANFGAPVALTAGSASSGSISTLTAGNHTVEAIFTSSDTNFNDSNDLLDGGQTVNKRNTLTTVSSSLNPSTFGESVSFTATVVGTGAGAGNPSGGSVQFKIDGVDFGAPVALTAGSASSGSISTLTAGNHTVEAVFTSADTNFNDSNDLLDGGQTVNKRNTLTTVSSSLNPSTFGESVSFTATVVGTGAGAGNPSGGSVQFKIDGANFGAPVALTAGSASSGSISTLTAGNHTVEAIFTSSDTNFNDSNDLLDGGQTVNKRNTLTTVSSSLNPSTFGESVSFTATVVGTGAGAGNPSGGSVQFKIDGANFGAPVALTVGSASSGSISTLTAGNHTVEAIFTSSDTNFNDSNDLLDGGQVVNKRNTLTTVSSSLNPSTFGESVSFTATVVGTGAGAGNPSGGSVQFKIDGANFGAPVALTAGSASSGSISTLTAGNHTVEAIFTSSDTNFNDSNDLLDGGQTVNKRNTLTTVSSSLNPSTFGESVSFTATVVGTGAGAGNPSGGSVQFKIDGVDFGAPVALTAGSASSGSISTLSAGNHTVEAVFTSSDTNFNDSNDLLDGGQVVNKRNTLTTVSSSLNPSTFGESVSFTATVVGTGAGAGNPSGGSVQFKIDGVDFGAPVALTAGSASSGSISTLTAGNHTVEAIFTSSDTNFNDSNDLLDGGQIVNKRNTLTTVSSSLNPSTFGESVSFTATVVGTGAGAGNPSGGSVQFKIDGVDFGAPVALTAGSASSGSISTLTAGNHTVEAIFTSSDTNFNDSNDLLDGGQIVNKRNTLTTVSSSLNPSTFGESVSFTATVVGTGAGAGNPSGGSVQFKIDGANFGAPVALTAGSASSGSISTLTAGNHVVEAIFTSSDTNFNDSNDLLDGGQTVNKRNTLTTVSSSLNPSTFGESVSFTATVVGTGAGAGNPSGGSVQFKIDGANFGAPVALTAGSASSGSISTLTAGNHVVEAIFTSSDTNFNDSNDLLDGGQTVNKRNTLTTVSSSLNPSTFGESVSFTATVVGTGAGAGNPSGGSVQFKIDGANFGAPVALTAGSASSGSISTLSAGNHTVEAVFTSADANFNDSNDLLDGGQTVNKRNTLTTISSSLNPSTFGESVSFTATVVGTGAGAGNPSGGSVQFKIDGVDFGAPVALTAGSASSGSISTLSAGNHTVEAVFTSADANFNDSNDLLDGGQTVNKRNTLTTISSSLNPSTFGESVSFTATVVGTGAGAGNPSGGSVQFKIDGVDFGSPVALTAGSASSGSISTLSAGNHIVEAVFTSADANFNDSNDLLDGGQTVNKRNTLTTVSSSLNPSTFGESVSFTATVVGTGAGAGNPSGGSVQFKIDGVDFGAPVALVAGSASSGSINTLSAGNHTVEAVFTSSDTNFNDSNDLLDGGQTVNKRNTLTTVSSSLNPSTFGESVSFTATVVGTGAGTGNPSGGSVQFKIDGSDFGAPVALTAGSASSGSTSSLPAGNHTVEAIFTSADANFNDSNDLLDGGQTVNKRNTLTTVSSSLNPSTFGQSVSFSATVVGTGAGTGNPSGGSVQFKIDGANFGAPVALTAGSASSGSTSSLTAGNHTVEAIFTSADANFNDSNDLLDGGQTVNKRNTLTTISSSLNPSVYGQNVTFTAIVVGTGAGAGNPSGGSVQFKIDGVNAGAPVALTAGSASSGAINNINAGTHTVEAVFTSADTNFNNSSDLLDGGQTVNKAPLTITASSHTVIFSAPVPTITASYTGFVLGQGPSNLTTQPTCSTTYTTSSIVGTYPTKCENAVSSNYSFTYVDGTVTVLTACSVFNGFLQPVGGSVELGTGGSFANPVRSFKLNSTIPVKFSAICLGVPLTTGIHTLQAVKYNSSTTSDPAIDATPTDAATDGNQFRLTDGEWHFNLSTKGLGNNGQGTWLLVATLFDGSKHTVWVSIKK